MKTSLVAAACAIALLMTAAPSVAGTPINVCAAKDGALRLSSSCKAGEKSMRFAEWEPDHPGSAAADQKPAADPQIAVLEGRIAQLEADSQRQRPDKTEALRVDALEAKMTALSAHIDAVDARAADAAKVAAMADLIEVEIHDLGVSLEAKIAAADATRRSTNRDMMDVVNNNADHLHDLVMRVTALESRRDPADSNSRSPAPASTVVANRVQAPFEVVGSDGRVILRVSEKAMDTGGRVAISPGTGGGNFSVRVHTGAGVLAAALGQATKGGGLVIVNDSAGHESLQMNGAARSFQARTTSGEIVAAVAARDDKGGLVAIIKGETPIAFLSPSSGGDGGNVTTALNSGFGVFSAGAAQDGAGEACVNRKTQAGTARLACLGLGLPSAGMGK